MKIAHLLCYAEPRGGIIRSVSALSEYSVSSGHEVDWIYWWGKGPDAVPPGVNVKKPRIVGFPENGFFSDLFWRRPYYRPIRGQIFLSSPFTVFQLKNKLLKHERYDVIFCHRPIYLGSCTLREPCAVVIHNSLDHEFPTDKNGRQKLFWRKAIPKMLRNKFVLTVSETLKKDVQENYKKGESENKTFCAYNPIDVERITRLARRAPPPPLNAISLQAGGWSGKKDSIC